jgi:hypothetical protein
MADQVQQGQPTHIMQLPIPDISKYRPDLEKAPNFEGFVKWAAMCHVWTKQAGPEIERLRKENDELQSQNEKLTDDLAAVQDAATELADLQEAIQDFDRGMLDKEELIRRVTE